MIKDKRLAYKTAFYLIKFRATEAEKLNRKVIKVTGFSPNV